MHASSIIFAGFGGFNHEMSLPPAFQKLFHEDPYFVLNEEGNPLRENLVIPESEETDENKYFRMLRRGTVPKTRWEVCGFLFADYDSTAVLDLDHLLRLKDIWLPYAVKIGQKYQVPMQAQIHVVTPAATGTHR